MFPKHLRLPITALALAVAAAFAFLPAAPAGAATFAYIPDFDGEAVIRVSTDNPVNRRSVGLTCAPYGVAVAPDGQQILATCETEGLLVVIDDAAFEPGAPAPVFDMVLVGDAPRGVAFDPAGRHAYVANHGNGTVTRIDMLTLALNTITVGQGPEGIAAMHDEVAGDSKVYVANGADNTVSVITDDGTGTTVRTIQNIGIQPVGVAVSPDGRYAYVANRSNGGTGTVAVIRTRDDQVVRTLSAGRGPWGVAVGGQGEFVFVSNSLIDPARLRYTVSVFRVDNHVTDNADPVLLGTFNVGTGPLGIAAPGNGRFAYAVNGDATISKITIQNQPAGVTTIDVAEMEGAFALGAFIGGRPPARPSGFTATVGGFDRIDLAWTDASTGAHRATGFKIERRKTDEDRYSEIAQVPIGASTSYTYRDFALQSNTTYQYRIRAFNEAADSPSVTSSPAAVTTEKGGFSWCFIGLLRH